MQSKQHTGLKGRFLAMLFLIFNSVCTAAPVLEKTGENYKEDVSIRLVQLPVPVENEEENHATSSGYTNQTNCLCVRKLCERDINYLVASSVVNARSAIDPPKVYLNNGPVLPLPGYYAFLFRYNLF